jgi:hypothetical protein
MSSGNSLFNDLFIDAPFPTAREDTKSLFKSMLTHKLPPLLHDTRPLDMAMVVGYPVGAYNREDVSMFSLLFRGDPSKTDDIVNYIKEYNMRHLPKRENLPRDQIFNILTSPRVEIKPLYVYRRIIYDKHVFFKTLTVNKFIFTGPNFSSTSPDLRQAIVGFKTEYDPYSRTPETRDILCIEIPVGFPVRVINTGIFDVTKPYDDIFHPRDMTSYMHSSALNETEILLPPFLQFELVDIKTKTISKPGVTYNYTVKLYYVKIVGDWENLFKRILKECFSYEEEEIGEREIELEERELEKERKRYEKAIKKTIQKIISSSIKGTKRKYVDDLDDGGDARKKARFVL